MGTVVVTGGTGTFGRQLVPLLEKAGHEVRVLSRSQGAGTHRGDLATGEGVAAALAGAGVVVHAASDTRRMGRADERQTANLLAAAGGAGHLLYLSIVGIDTIGLPYYRRKLACERLIEAGPVPWTILRATQFHELMAMVCKPLDRLPFAPLPLDFRCQPVAAADVAERMAGLVEAGPSDRAPDFGGPRVFALRELVGLWRERRGRPVRLLNVPVPGAVARGFREGRNTCPDHAEGRRSWEEFVESTATAAD
ncbi:MAG: SDR family oxidoreductase [Acidimicrobiales bacterium]